MRLATSSGRSAEFATVPGPHGSGPASAAEQGEIDVGSGGDGGGGGGGDGGDSRSGKYPFSAQPPRSRLTITPSDET